MIRSQRIIDKEIEQAMSKGYFENLSGKGSPMQLDDDINVPESLRMAYRILKNAGCSPREVQVLNEINTLKQKIKNQTNNGQKQLLMYQLSILESHKEITTV